MNESIYALIDSQWQFIEKTVDDQRWYSLQAPRLEVITADHGYKASFISIILNRFAK